MKDRCCSCLCCNQGVIPWMANCLCCRVLLVIGNIIISSSSSSSNILQSSIKGGGVHLAVLPVRIAIEANRAVRIGMQLHFAAITLLHLLIIIIFLLSSSRCTAGLTLHEIVHPHESFLVPIAELRAVVLNPQQDAPRQLVE